MSKVGIYAGTFDPVHNGHAAFAWQALEECGLDKVWFMVEPRPRRKQGVKAFEHRVRMVQLAIAQEPRFGSIVLEQPRFTVHGTLPLLLNRFGGDTISFLIGEDLLSHLTHWPHIGELIENVEFIIGVRKQSEQRIRDTIATIEKMRGHPFRYIIVHTLAKNINSTQIRKDVRGNRELADVHPAVARYIKRNNLYTSQNI
jgi:nicotinate (nicotinamide) nucleotide adenylyltransferase